MDPAQTNFQSSHQSDGFSSSATSDDEDDVPDDIDPTSFPISVDPRSEAIGSHARGPYQDVIWRVRNGIQRAHRSWELICEIFRRKRWPSTSIIGPQPLEELPIMSESRSFAKQKHEKSTTVIGQLREILLSSWLNSLLVFIPIGATTYLTKSHPLLVFGCNALAIVPLSALLTEATELIAAEAGDAIGALLNISFGNIVELILLIALANNQIRIVQASILGSILVNLLLILGSALLASDIAHLDPIYNAGEAQLLACLLFVSVFVILIPTAFVYTVGGLNNGSGATLKMSRISALIVLLIYILYFVHEIKSRQTNEKAITPPDIESRPTMVGPSHQRSASGSQTLPPRTIRFADEDDENTGGNFGTNATDAEMNGFTGDDVNADFMEHRGRRGDVGNTPSVYQQLPDLYRHSRSHSHGSSRGYYSRDSSMSGERRGFTLTLQLLRETRTSMDQSIDSPVHDPQNPTSHRVSSVVVLISTSVFMSMCAEFLVSTLDEITHEEGLSESFIGLIILPIVGNVAEYLTVVIVATRGKLDLAIAVAVGSSIQIALCVTPLTIMAGWALQKDLELTFDPFEMATLVGAVLLVNLLILSEQSSSLRTTGLKGALICACYVIFSLGAYLFPQPK
ncbi:Sodium/calcium exchanger protein-domain-containing protein [Dactylonectria estremocensis]|uniref:Sodium/calcium exchanger protein-domain-containing protein n=1 Tax=Dactylonectria estremocensis TaxID=1079267 RepID=A0A9P9IJW2_9HYPO|nr:Sodium/calcium exchanger protein-domain-containing protein [Dactylonectria estremocensis]